MKPVILTFEPQPLPDGSWSIGFVPAAFTVWSQHFGFENGKLAVTLIRMQDDRKDFVSISVRTSKT